MVSSEGETLVSVVSLISYSILEFVIPVFIVQLHSIASILRLPGMRCFGIVITTFVGSTTYRGFQSSLSSHQPFPVRLPRFALKIRELKALLRYSPG
jgi:hypothetical protein